MSRQASQTADRGAAQNFPRATDGTAFFTPDQLAARWAFHPESVRRILRRGQVESVVIGRRRLVPVSEVARVETDGLATRTN